METLLFFDMASIYAYDPRRLARQGMGGTQSTTIRVAEALADRYHVMVAQGPRTERFQSERGVDYLPVTFIDKLPTPEHVVVLRHPNSGPWLRQLFPRAHMALWTHVANPTLTNWERLALRQFDAMICLSTYHHQIQLNQKGYPVVEDGLALGADQFVIIPNPVDDDLDVDETPVDPNKLLFMSTPTRGLEHTMAIFKELRDENGGFELYVANPGYDVWELPELEGLHDLGILAHGELIQHIRTSLCTFYLNGLEPEAFGLVFAISNAVGTPVLTDPCGAAEEVLGDPRQLVDIEDAELVKRTVVAWRDGGRPKVRLRPEYRTSAVAKRWCEFLTRGLTQKRSHAG